MILLSKKAVGLNIADHTIEVVEITKSGGRPKVVSLARTVLIPGIVEEGRVHDSKKLSKIIKSLLEKAQPKSIEAKKIFFTLPESRVYTHVFSIEPYHKKDNIEDLVQREAKTHVPITEDELLYSYKVVDIHKNKGMVLLVAASHTIVAEWQQFFKDMKIELEEFDIETLANYRDLFQAKPKKPVCLVDIGAATTNVAVFDHRGLRYVHTSNIAGNRLTTIVAKELGITKEDAEKRKIKFGLVTRNNEMYSVLARGVNIIFKEVMTVLAYYHENSKQKVSRVTLLGGSSQLKGLVDYLHTNLNLPAEIGVSQLTRNSIPLEYITAIGAALRGLDRKWLDDPIIHLSLSEQEKINREKKRKAKEAANERKKKKEGNGKKKPKIIRKGAVVNLDMDMAEAEMEDEDDFGEHVDETKQKRKLLMQKIILIIILLGGLTGVFLAYSFRAKEKKTKEASLKEMAASQLSQTQVFDLSLPISVNSAAKTADQITGRLVSDTIATAGSYKEALTKSFRNTKKDLAEGEILWETVLNPLDDPAAQETFVPPHTFNWLAYNESEASKMLLAEIDKINVKDVEYSLVNMEINSITGTEDKNIYKLQAQVTISVAELLPTTSLSETGADQTAVAEEVEPSSEGPAEGSPEEETAQSSSNMVLIKETGLGWLNARSGAATTFPIVGQATVGQQYEVLEENEGWTRIKLSSDVSGWVINEYLEKIIP